MPFFAVDAQGFGSLMNNMGWMLGSWRLQIGKNIGAIGPGSDVREAMVFFEEIVALFEIPPKNQQHRLIFVGSCQGFEAIVCEPAWENVNRQMSLALILDQHGEPINFLDPIVRNRDTANRSAVPMQKDLPARILMRTKYPVRGVRIIDVQAQVEIALWVEPI